MKYFYLTYGGKVIGPESFSMPLVHFDIKKECTINLHIRSTGIPCNICSRKYSC